MPLFSGHLSGNLAAYVWGTNENTIIITTWYAKKKQHVVIKTKIPGRELLVFSGKTPLLIWTLQKKSGKLAWLRPIYFTAYFRITILVALPVCSQLPFSALPKSEKTKVPDHFSKMDILKMSNFKIFKILFTEKFENLLIQYYKKIK